MKLNRNWLNEEFVDLSEVSDKEFVETLTVAGQKVETYERLDAEIRNVVVGRVLSIVRHENSDHMWVCQVDVGRDEPVQIVTGAQNVREGDLVPAALHNSYLPGGIHITEGKLRGVVSNGMLCSLKELNLTLNDFPYAIEDGIWILEEDCKPGDDINAVIGNNDTVVDFEITNNRPDCYSVIGLAREAAAAFNLPMRHHEPTVKGGAAGELTELLDVEVPAEDLCSRYTARMVRNVKVAPSPKWLRQRLRANGVRPINNIVDISNFVLFEVGQPLHTFDADQIIGGKVIVRRAEEGEKIVTLDGIERTLHSFDMVIANAEGPMCIAGVFGGEKSGVTENTVNVFVESAYFDPHSIRKTSKTQGLQTDASFRYERGADLGIIPFAAKRAALLILELAGGHIEGKTQISYPAPIEKKVIDLDYDRIEAFIGKKIGHDVIENILTYLTYDFIEKRQGGAKVAAPSYMIDVYRECDVVEEILRIYSYNNVELPKHMKMSVGTTPDPDPEATRNYISNFLVADGFVETMNNSLTKSAYYSGLTTFPEERCVKIVNPLSSDLNVLRQTLILNGLEVIAYNANRQITSLRTFEYGSVYQRLPDTDGTTLASYEEHQCFALFVSGPTAKSWRLGEQKGNYFQLKGYLEQLCSRYGIDLLSMETEAAPSDIFAEGIVYRLPGTHEVFATLGTVSPALARKFDVRQPVFTAEIVWPVLLKLISRVKVKFQEMPKFPEVRRDLALLIDESVSYADLSRAAYKAVKKILKQVTLFDVYRGDKIPEGKKQYALNFVLQDPDKTLTDNEVEKAMDRLLATYQNTFGATLR